MMNQFSIHHSAFSICSPEYSHRWSVGRNIFQETDRSLMAFKKFTASETILKPDPRFNSKLVSKFINCLMWQGKKTVAQKIFYDAMEQCTKKMKEVPPLELFETAVNNVKPYVE